MATRKEIYAGPSKWDLIIKSLAGGQKVEFKVGNMGTCLVRILSVAAEDGSGENWIITGHLTHPAVTRVVGYWPFRGYYSTRMRREHMNVHQFVDIPPPRAGAIS